MCTRFSATYRIETAAKRFRFSLPHPDRTNWTPKYNIAPTDEALVVIEEGNERKCKSMVFGLVPHWARDIKIGLRCLNARAETIMVKPAFKESFRKRRCLIIADGFYEWRHEGKLKVPYRVVLKNREPFAFAGIWDRWVNVQGKEFLSFSIVTTESNEWLQALHPRAPAILRSTDEDLWVDARKEEPKIFLNLLKPFSPSEFEMYQVSPYVNNSSNKGQECIQAVGS